MEKGTAGGGMESANRDDGSERRGRMWNRGTGRASSIESFFFVPFSFQNYLSVPSSVRREDWGTKRGRGGEALPL